ncbi:hypothetical protein BD770DRAFT_427135 [Pilaira anomala]|nr:hypothetical protein BD770DRAFT_427135 [Pilaira anomala]
MIIIAQKTGLTKTNHVAEFHQLILFVNIFIYKALLYYSIIDFTTSKELQSVFKKYSPTTKSKITRNSSNQALTKIILFSEKQLLSYNLQKVSRNQYYVYLLKKKLQIPHLLKSSLGNVNDVGHILKGMLNTRR